MAHTENPDLVPLACALADSLSVLAPMGWAKLEGELTRDFRLAQLRAHGNGSAAPKPKPNLFVDAKAEAQRLSEGLLELSGLFEASGHHWHGPKFVCERNAEELTLSLRDAADAEIANVRVGKEPLEALIVTDTLLDALAGTEPTFLRLQQNLENAVGPTIGHRFSPSNGELVLQRTEGDLVARAEWLGTYDAQEFLWEWSWAEPAFSKTAVARYCRPDGQAPGLSALWRERFHGEEGLLWAICGHVSASIGAQGIYRAPQPNGSARFYAVMQLR